MVAGIVTVGRRQYASGLYWENSPTGRVSQAAKEAARQPGSRTDFFATRLGNKQGRVPQFGLAPPTEGFRAGMPSLAGCLANQQPGSWIGAFKLREGTAVVVVRDDLIVPDGDIFFLDESEARDRLYQEMAIGGFQRLYAPEPWGVPGADTMPLTLLLNERKDVRLRPIALTAQGKLALAVILGLFLLGLGAGWYMQVQQAKMEEERLAQLAAIERLKAEARKHSPLAEAPVYPPPERKWEDHPHALDVIDACKKALNDIGAGVSGWKLSDVSCDESGLKVTWDRTGGFSAPPPHTSVNDMANRATGAIPFPAKLQSRGHEDLWDPDAITKRYLAQNWTGSIRRIPDDPPPPPPPDYKGEWNPPPAPWVKRSFTVNVPVLPGTLPLFLSDVPGLFVSSLKNPMNGVWGKDVWTVEGEIYENRR